MKISCLESCLTQRKKTTRKGSDGLKATRPEKAHTSASTRQWCRMLPREERRDGWTLEVKCVTF